MPINIFKDIQLNEGVLLIISALLDLRFILLNLKTKNKVVIHSI